MKIKQYVNRGKTQRCRPNRNFDDDEYDEYAKDPHKEEPVVNFLQQKLKLLEYELKARSLQNILDCGGGSSSSSSSSSSSCGSGGKKSEPTAQMPVDGGSNSHTTSDSGGGSANACSSSNRTGNYNKSLPNNLYKGGNCLQTTANKCLNDLHVITSASKVAQGIVNSDAECPPSSYAGDNGPSSYEPDDPYDMSGDSTLYGIRE
jgi:hypothetical protein